MKNEIKETITKEIVITITSKEARNILQDLNLFGGVCSNETKFLKRYLEKITNG